MKLHIRRHFWTAAVVLAIAGVGLAITYGVRDDAGTTSRQVVAGEGRPGPITIDAANRLWVRSGIHPERWQASVVNDGDSQNGAEQELLAGTAGMKVAILSLTVSTDTSLTFVLEDEDDNALVTLYLAARGGAVLRFPPEAPLCLETADKALQFQGSAAGNISVTATGYLYP